MSRAQQREDELEAGVVIFTRPLLLFVLFRLLILSTLDALTAGAKWAFFFFWCFKGFWQLPVTLGASAPPSALEGERLIHNEKRQPALYFMTVASLG